MTKRVYLFDGLSIYNNLNTNYNGFWDCQESPLEPGIYIVPTNSTEIEPPTFDGTIDTCTWDGTQWSLTAIPKPAPPVAQTSQTSQASKDQPTTNGTQTI